MQGMVNSPINVSIRISHGMLGVEASVSFQQSSSTLTPNFKIPSTQWETLQTSAVQLAHDALTENNLVLLRRTITSKLRSRSTFHPRAEQITNQLLSNLHSYGVNSTRALPNLTQNLNSIFTIITEAFHMEENHGSSYSINIPIQTFSIIISIFELAYLEAYARLPITFPTVAVTEKIT